MVWFLLNGAFVWVWLCKLMTNLWQTYKKTYDKLVTVNKLINHISAILIITKQHRIEWNRSRNQTTQSVMFVCSFHLYSCFCFHYFACVYVVMYAFVFVHVILCNDICFFVCWCLLVFVYRSGLVPLDADNLCLIYSCKVVKMGVKN